MADAPQPPVPSAGAGTTAARQQELSELLAFREELLDASVDCIKVIDPEGTLIHMNRPGREALGVSAEQAAAGFGMEWLGLLPADARIRGRRALKRAGEGKKVRFGGRTESGAGRSIDWDNILTPLKGEDGDTKAILCVSRDVTAQKEAERRLRLEGDLDGLTGVLNRRAFRARLAETIGHARRAGDGRVGLILVDLDHFKIVNDTLGHPAGDHLLRTLADRLVGIVPEDAFVGRLGGDEFAVAARCGGGDELRDLATSVTGQLADPIVHEGRSIRTGMSLGCALFPRDASEDSGLMTCADLALREVKAEGRAGVAFFTPAMLSSLRREAEERRLAREVVERDALVPLYRPIMRLDGGGVVGLESLLAWRSTEGDVRSAAHLGAALEDDQLAPELHRGMREKVLADIAAWEGSGMVIPPVSVSAAPAELLHDDFASRLLAALQAHRATPGSVELQVCESVFEGRGREIAGLNLEALREAGVRVAITDFGTGDLTLASLSRIPVDAFRLDPRFVAQIGEDVRRAPLVGSVVALGDALSVDVVAVGVGTRRERDALMTGGCRFGQGDLFGVPTDASRVTTLIDRPVARG